MEKVKISKKAVQEYEGNYWNAFNEVLALSKTDELTGKLRQCHFVYWYASEIQNGGHEQYLINKGYFDHNEVIESLKALGAEAHSLVLAESLKYEAPLNDNELDDDSELDQLSDILHEFDLKLYKLKPKLFDLLEAIQKEFENELVEWIE